ncbi:PLP-dependent aminotransferase family protein [Mesorhizobium opportunistum]|uniref:aminotransferase-like domain-containing protein n=1 Tax=Mesorhizobium opportunistum TaxID=593909 RepID=UPI00333B2564
MAAVPPGSKVISEEIGHHTLKPLTSYLSSKLLTVEADKEGMCPQALGRACSEGGVRALFVMPGPISPTVSVMGPARRIEIVEIARRYGLFIIENDPLGMLVEGGLTPFATLAPERTFYVSTFTKTVLPGLRTGYLVVPTDMIAATTNRAIVTNWMAPPLLAEIAARWVEDGTAKELVLWQRDALLRRHEIVDESLQGLIFGTHPQSLHIWLRLPQGYVEQEFVANARHRGVSVAPGRAFALADKAHPPAVRISVGSSRPEELRRGLTIIGEILKGELEPILHTL